MLKHCGVCGARINHNDSVCSVCASICDGGKFESIENLKKFWTINQSRMNQFVKTDCLKSFLSDHVIIDSRHEMFYIENKNTQRPIVYKFCEVVDFKAGSIPGVTVEKKSGGIGRAVVGGALFGVTGAVVGASTAKTTAHQVGGSFFITIHLKTPYWVKTLTIFRPPVGLTEFLNRCVNITSSLQSFCPNCGKEVGNAKFCPYCGIELRKVAPTNFSKITDNQSYPKKSSGKNGYIEKPPKKKVPIRKIVLWIILIIVLIPVITIILSFSFSPRISSALSKMTSSTINNSIIDSQKFSKINYSKLKALMGGPGKKEPSGVKLFKSDGKTVIGDIYDFQNDKFDFIIADNKVVRMEFHTNLNNPIKYKDDDTIFQMFGLQKSGIPITTDKESSLEYKHVSNKVENFWVTDMDRDKKTFTEVYITYDENYFGQN
ncbi:MAG TPA: hypothetical protein DEP60_08670 [Ruminococcaceae bacterium]|nr:hypothetical protein [Oscillospiraceae bacterium]